VLADFPDVAAASNEALDALRRGGDDWPRDASSLLEAIRAHQRLRDAATARAPEQQRRIESLLVALHDEYRKPTPDPAKIELRSWQLALAYRVADRLSFLQNPAA
jgi:hypothetical protein